MTPLEELELQAYEVMNILTGLPTRESLRAAYLRFNFSRALVADHFQITPQRLNSIKKKLLGDEKLPSGPSYIRQWNEVKWYTKSYPTWTHVPASDKPRHLSEYKYHQ
jgi:hypothetical protein